MKISAEFDSGQTDEEMKFKKNRVRKSFSYSWSIWKYEEEALKEISTSLSEWIQNEIKFK